MGNIKDLRNKILEEVLPIVEQRLNESKTRAPWKKPKQRKRYNNPFAFEPKKEDFLEYIDKYVDFIGYHVSIDKKETFLDIDGFDGGDVREKGLESGARFSKPESIDKEIRNAADYFGHEYPKVSFSDFCKHKAGKPSYAFDSEKMFDLNRNIIDDVPSLKERLDNIGFDENYMRMYGMKATYNFVLDFLRNEYGFNYNWKYTEDGDYGDPCWMYQTYIPSKDSKDAKDGWKFEESITVMPEGWKEFYEKHPDLNNNHEWDVIISAINEMITRIENNDF